MVGLAVVVGNFVNFSGFMVRQCCGCGSWWFVGCCDLMVVVSCGSVAGSIGWFDVGFLFFSIR